MINKYIKKVENSIEKFDYIIEEKIINSNILTEKSGTIDGEIFFTDSSYLNFMEVIIKSEFKKEKYKYQYMNENNELIFRYDNAKHHKELKTYPHHKHTQEGVFEADEPNIENILNEIEKNI